MVRRPALGIATLLALAFVGIALGHGVTYAGLEPAAVVREAWLAATGHGYLPLAGTLAFATAVTAAGWLLLRGAVGETDTRGPLLSRILVLELTGFVLLEVLERGVTGGGFGDLVRVLPVGLAVQSVIACLIALAGRWLVRVGAAVAALAGSARPPAPQGIVPVSLRPGPVFAPSPAHTPLGGRAPPRSR